MIGFFITIIGVVAFFIGYALGESNGYTGALEKFMNDRHREKFGDDE